MSEAENNMNDTEATQGAPVPSPAATRLHEHLGNKLDDASYLLGFARSIIDGLTGGIPASDKTIAEFKRCYDGYLNSKHAASSRPSSRT